MIHYELINDSINFIQFVIGYFTLIFMYNDYHFDSSVAVGPASSFSNLKYIVPSISIGSLIFCLALSTPPTPLRASVTYIPI